MAGFLDVVEFISFVLVETVQERIQQFRTKNFLSMTSSSSTRTFVSVALPFYGFHQVALFLRTSRPCSSFLGSNLLRFHFANPNVCRRIDFFTWCDLMWRRYGRNVQH